MIKISCCVDGCLALIAMEILLQKVLPGVQRREMSFCRKIAMESRFPASNHIPLSIIHCQSIFHPPENFFPGWFFPIHQNAHTVNF